MFFLPFYVLLLNQILMEMKNTFSAISKVKFIGSAVQGVIVVFVLNHTSKRIPIIMT